jgi:hypothetical protein
VNANKLDILYNQCQLNKNRGFIVVVFCTAAAVVINKHICIYKVAQGCPIFSSHLIKLAIMSDLNIGGYFRIFGIIGQRILAYLRLCSLSVLNWQSLKGRRKTLNACESHDEKISTINS